MTARKRVVDVLPRKRSAPDLSAVRVLVLPDEGADTSYLDQDEFADRRAEYERGEFAFVVVVAEADVVVDGVVQVIRSGGLWGVESDDGAYLDEVAGEEYAALRKILKTIGVATSEIPEQPQTEWRA